jgi:FAD synthase
VEFLQRLRGMEKFDSVPALVAQMHQDVEQTQKFVAEMTDGREER